MHSAGRKYPDKNKYPRNHIACTWPVYNKLETLYQLSTRSGNSDSKLATLYQIFSSLSFLLQWVLDRHSCRLFVKRIRSNRVFYYIFTGSEHDFFPFHAEWLSKGWELEMFYENTLRNYSHLQLILIRLCLLAVWGE